VHPADGEAKFWLEPEISVAMSHGLPDRRLREVEDRIRKHEHETREAWQEHFPG
jgi:hypothetical protein